MASTYVKMCKYVNEFDRCCMFPLGGLNDADQEDEACRICDFYPHNCEMEKIKLIVPKDK